MYFKLRLAAVKSLFEDFEEEKNMNEGKDLLKRLVVDAKKVPFGKTEARQSSFTVAQNRSVPPQDLEAENATLGGMLSNAKCQDDVMALLNSEDFYSPANQSIFEAACELRKKGKPVDLVTLKDYLDGVQKLQQSGGLNYLVDLFESVVSPGNTLHHAKIVKDKASRRELINVCNLISTACFEVPDTHELFGTAEKAVFGCNMATAKKGLIPAGEEIGSVFDRIHENMKSKAMVTGTPTGFIDLDSLTLGYQPSDLIIVSGRPSMGKTAFALSSALKSSVGYDEPSVIFSLEMSTEQLLMRLLAIEAKVPLMDIRSGRIADEQLQSLYDAADRLSKAPIFIEDTPAMKVWDFQSRCRAFTLRYGQPGLVVVDYLQLMDSGVRTNNREQQIATISRTLKATAKEINGPVMALSQLNRKLEERTDKRPLMSDLRESGQIEQDADLIMFLYRDAVYNKAEDNPKKNIAEAIVAKQRNGPTGKVELFFNEKFTRFENLQKETPA